MINFCDLSAPGTWHRRTRTGEVKQADAGGGGEPQKCHACTQMASWLSLPADLQQLILWLLPQEAIISFRGVDKRSRALVDQRLDRVTAFYSERTSSLCKWLARSRASHVILYGKPILNPILSAVGTRLRVLKIELLSVQEAWRLTEACSWLNTLKLGILSPPERRETELIRLSPKMSNSLEILSIREHENAYLCSLEDFRCFSRLRRLRLEGCAFTDSRNLLNSLPLQSLKLSYSSAYRVSAPVLVPPFDEFAACLRKVELYADYAVGQSTCAVTMAWLLRDATNLEELWFPWYLYECRRNRDEFSDRWAELMVRLPRLRILRLPRIYHLHNEPRDWSPNSSRAFRAMCTHATSLTALYSMSLPIQQSDIECLVNMPQLRYWEIKGFEDAGTLPYLFCVAPLQPDPDLIYGVAPWKDAPTMSSALVFHLLSRLEVFMAHIVWPPKVGDLSWPFAMSRFHLALLLIKYWEKLPVMYHEYDGLTTFVACARSSISAPTSWLERTFGSSDEASVPSTQIDWK